MFAIVRDFMVVLVACAFAGTAMAQDLASETRLGEDGFESPAASLKRMDWLVGQWVGEGIQGGPAIESWLPPTGGTMVGTFVQQTDEGGIMFTEHLYLMEEEGSLVLRLKHFNADLTGWEEKDDMLTFRLVAMEPCAAYFRALTLRCADAEKPGEGLVAAVRMQSGGELVFRFTKTHAQSGAYGCDTKSNVEEGLLCLLSLEQETHRQINLYARMAQQRFGDDPELAGALAEANEQFFTYRNAACNLLAEHLLGDTQLGNDPARFSPDQIQSIERVQYCKIDANRQRALSISRNWLAHSQGTPTAVSEQ